MTVSYHLMVEVLATNNGVGVGGRHTLASNLDLNLRIASGRTTSIRSVAEARRRK